MELQPDCKEKVARLIDEGCAHTQPPDARHRAGSQRDHLG